ncbi:MAG: polyprenyl diphosphate synthase, partial [Acidimicrobiales bacterium]
IEGAQAIGVKWLTVFAFSTENWKRPPEEVKFLMNFNESLLERRSHELNDMGIRIRFAGRRNWRVPKRVLRRMDEAVELTKNNREMTLTIAFNYGGRAEIIDAVKQMLEDGVAIDRITERKLERYLYEPTMPDVDLLIRTSGEHRLSNFLLWQMAYSELLFTDTLWPDFRRKDLYEAVLEYQARDRRFGGLNR